MRERLAPVVTLPLAALGFLTVLPVSPGPNAPDDAFGRSVGYFPLVGALVGGIVAGVDLALGTLFPRPVATALDLAAFALLTGGLHLDGLMDSCDGLFVRRPAAERLAIMRDSRVGSFGVVGGVVVLLVQYACLAELAGPARIGGLLAMATLGRWAMVYATFGFPYARPEGLGVAFKRSVGWRELVLATPIAAAVVAAALGPAGLALLGIAWLGAWLFAAYALTKVPGLTGDLYGAINEIAATLVLLALVGAQMRGWMGG